MSTKKLLPTLPVTTNEVSHPDFGMVKFRNWTLGEQQDTIFKRQDKKSVLEILEGILHNCVTEASDTNSKTMRIKDMPLTLAELVFIKIREISVGDTQDYIINCENEICQELYKESEGKDGTVRVTADLKRSAIVVPEEFKGDIVVGNYTIRVKMPSLSFLGYSAEQLDGTSEEFISSNIEFIASEDGELWDFSEYELKDKVAFVKTLPPSFLIHFMNNYKYLPRVETPVKGTCKHCNTDVEKNIIGISSLFTD